MSQTFGALGQPRPSYPRGIGVVEPPFSFSMPSATAVTGASIAVSASPISTTVRSQHRVAQRQDFARRIVFVCLFIANAMLLGTIIGLLAAQ